jgi:hypothetical protein
MIKKLNIFRLVYILIFGLNVFAQQPVIFYSDILSGPNIGGENNKGAYVTIFGKNFGTIPGSSYVSIGGGTADNYPVWSDTLISFQLGTNATTGMIVIHTDQGTSNGIMFTLRDCDIYFASTAGSDSYSGTVDFPYRHLSKARSEMDGGDICYIRGGTYTTEGENSSGKNFYVSGSYPWGGNASAGNPHCMIGYPGESVILQASEDGDGIANYCGSDEQCAICSHIVFANFTIDANNYEATMNWRGMRNSASGEYRVRDIRVVNVTVKNYLNTGAMGGTALFHAGGDGPIDNYKILGCSAYNMDSGSRLDHGIYISAGGDDVEIGWNVVHDIKRVISEGGDGNAGFGIQTYRGMSEHYADLTNVVIHDNIVYECPSRGGINLADYTVNSYAYNNIIYNCGYDGTETGYGIRVTVDLSPGTHYIFNNTIYNCGQVNASSNSSALGFSADDALHVYLRNNIIYAFENQSYIYNALSSESFTSSNNCWYGSNLSSPSDQDAVYSDPLFLAIESHEFHLLNGSPCIDKGYDTQDIVETDKDGIIRPQGDSVDIGAYEYEVSSFVKDKNLDEYILYTNEPNPFNQFTIIRYYLAEPGDVTLRIYDKTGRLVRTLVNEHQNAGEYDITWNCRDKDGNQAKTGVYIFKINAGDFNQAKKMIRLR